MLPPYPSTSSQDLTSKLNLDATVIIVDKYGNTVSHTSHCCISNCWDGTR